MSHHCHSADAIFKHMPYPIGLGGGGGGGGEGVDKTYVPYIMISFYIEGELSSC